MAMVFSELLVYKVHNNMNKGYMLWGIHFLFLIMRYRVLYALDQVADFMEIWLKG